MEHPTADLDRSGISLRVAKPADAAAVTAVLESAYPQLMAQAYHPDVLARVLPGMTRANPSLLASGSSYVAQTAEGEIVACGGWSFEEPGTREIRPGYAHLRHYGCHLAWVGRGLGRRLFERCRTDALDARVSTLLCFSSLNAELFYRALGFIVIERTEIGNGMPCPTVVMSRSIVAG